METRTIKAALIDMDGTLYDSMPWHARSWHRMTNECGFKTDEKEFYLYEGMTGAAVIDLIIMRSLGRHATEGEKERMYARKAELFNESGRKAPIPGAARMVSALMAAGVPRVLVTGSSQDSLLGILEEDYPGGFPGGMRITARDVTKGKPDPEPYLMGAASAGVQPSECLVVENAPLGVRSGKAAGCLTAAVTTGPIPRSEFVKAGADLIFDSMEDFATFLEKNLPAAATPSLPAGDPALAGRLDAAVDAVAPATVTVVTDTNVNALVLPLLAASRTLADASKTVIPPGEDHKSLDSVCRIWDTLEGAGATRRSLAVNIGGGLITDIGGFAAATYKRGIKALNLPTTLLGAVDAATGGKTGINYRGLKNEIGAFHLPEGVIVSAAPLATLPHSELLSGYAEMLKTGFIADAALYKSLIDIDAVLADHNALEGAINRCIEIKEEVVRLDPTEKGLRKILNFGHTAGHAFESRAFELGRPVPHGFAVAHGMLVELLLSHMLKGLDSDTVHLYASEVLKKHYPRLNMGCRDIDALMGLMARDKKNASAGHPNFTLLESVGQPVIDCIPGPKDIEAALEIYCDMV